MRDKDRSAVSASCDFSKEGVARFTRRGFDRHIFSLCQRTNIRQTGLKTNVIFGGKFFDKARICLRRPAAQLMIKMTNDQLAITKLDQPMKQRDRVGSARNSNEIATVRRKFPRRIGLKPSAARPH